MILCTFFSQNNRGGEERRGYHKFTQFGMMYSIYFSEYFSLGDLFFLSEGNSLHTAQCPFEVMADHYSSIITRRNCLNSVRKTEGGGGVKRLYRGDLREWENFISSERAYVT